MTIPNPRIQTDQYTFQSRSRSSSSLNRIVSPTQSFVSSKSTNCLYQCTDKPGSITSFSTSSSSHQRRFHSSHLGRPPGLNTARQPSIKLPTLPVTRSQNPPKIAPMKEVEKMITDLKKENFDLKLRLYHLEDLMTKNVGIYQLNEENCRLRLSLEDRDKQVQKLLQNKINQRSISTQTDLIPDPPTTPNSFYTAFESSSEAFGLIPIQPNTLSKQRQTSMRSSWQTVVANEDHLNSVVHSLQNFKINNDYTTNDDIFESWLHQNANDHEQGRLRHPML